MAGDLAPDTGGNDQALEYNRTGLVDERLVEELQNRNQRRRVEDVVKVVETEKHGDRVEPGGDEANGHGAHDGNGNHLFRARNFLGHEGGAVETGKSPVGVDQTHDECNAARGPARVVDKGRKDKFGILVRGSFGRDDDEYHEKGH